MFNNNDKGYQAFQVLYAGFVILPIVMGLDKFFDFLVYWPSYLAPFAAKILAGYNTTFMKIVGVIEIVAGLGVYFRPKIFAYVVSLWLLLITLNLLLSGMFFDIAVRDIGLMLAAFALGKLSEKYT